MIQYILESIAFQLIFLMIYDLFLKRETFFQWNRLYLLLTYTLSLILPWVKLELFQRTITPDTNFYPDFLWELNATEVAISTSNETGFLNFSWEYPILLSGMAIAAVLLGVKLLRLRKLRLKGMIQYFPKFTRVVIANSKLAFSFFKTIFLGDRLSDNERENIIKHELVHIEQRHSLDLMFFELMRIFCWFNPLVYVYQKKIAELHEFIADARVTKNSKREHYQFLLSQAFQTENISFVNQFFRASLIKKRIQMIQKSRSRKVWQLKYLLLLPVISVMLFYSSCQLEEGEDHQVTYSVEDIENLTSAEEKLVYNTLIELSVRDKDWELIVKDSKSSIEFKKPKDDSFISGPGGVPIKATMLIKSTILDDDFDFFPGDKSEVKISLGKSFHPDLNMLHHQLLSERRKLVESNQGEDAKIRDLDKQIQDVKKLIVNLGQGDVPFAWVEEVPVFPGCEGSQNTRTCFTEKMMEHIRKNFNYPQEAQDLELQGRVNIMFTIDKDGSIVDIKKRGPHELLENEAVRIIERLPKMKPGKYNGNTVGVPFSIPITFKLSENEQP